MRSIFLVLVLLVLWILGGSYLHWKAYCGAPVAAVESAAPLLVVKDGTAFKSISPDNHFGFLCSNYNYFKPVHPAVNNVMNETADYLKKNSNKALLINGSYTAGESNPSLYPNVGLARANAVKSILSNLGVSTKQLQIAGVEKSATCATNDTLIGGVSFAFTEAGSNDDRLAATKSRFEGKPMILYFETGKNNLSLSAQQRQDFTDLNYYLDQVDDASLEVSGHTDSAGNRNSNIQLAQERADFVRDYLVSNGIPGAKMSTSSSGPDRPIASNATAEGKAQNRRVEILLK